MDEASCEFPVGEMSSGHPGNETREEQTTDMGKFQDVGVKEEELCVQNSTQTDNSASLNPHLQASTGQMRWHVVQYDNGASFVCEDTVSERIEVPPDVEEDVFPYRGDLAQHVLKRGRKTYNICGECGYTTAKKAHFQEHIRIHTGEKPFKCDHCDYTSTRKYGLDSHMRRHTGEKPYKCGQCDYAASHKFKLDRHIEQNHSMDEANTKGEQTTDTGSYQDMEIEEKTLCDTNSGQPDKSSSLHRNLHPASDEKERHVELYANVPSSQRWLKRSRRKYSICGECGYTTAKKAHFQDHMRIHSGEKPYKCDHCDYTSARKYGLTSHMRTHAKEKSYKSDQRDFSSAQKTKLARRKIKRAGKKKRTGEKQFMCGRCGYRTAKKGHLLEHVRRHTGEKPFKCDQCDYCASRKFTLNVHMRNHMIKAKHTGEKRQLDRDETRYALPDEVLSEAHLGNEESDREERATEMGICQEMDKEIEGEEMCATNSTQADNSATDMKRYQDKGIEGEEMCAAVYTQHDNNASLQLHLQAGTRQNYMHVGQYDNDTISAYEDTASETIEVAPLLEEQTDEYPYTGDSERRRPKGAGRKNLICGECGYSTVQKTHFVEHMRIHTGEKPYKCDHCDYTSARKFSLTSHMRKHMDKAKNTGEKQLLDIDETRYALTDEVSDGHLVNDIGDKEEQATDMELYEDKEIEGDEVCAAVSTQLDNDVSLQLHLQAGTGQDYMHVGQYGNDTISAYEDTASQTIEVPADLEEQTDEYPYRLDSEQRMPKGAGRKNLICGECGYTTVQKTHFVEHMRIHTGEKPYKCDHCDYTSARKYSLVSHMRNHTGDKPYKCDQCDYSASNKSKLDRHIKDNHSMDGTDTKGEQTTDTGSYWDVESEDKTLCDTNPAHPGMQSYSGKKEKHVGLYANYPSSSYEDTASERVAIPQCIEERAGVEYETGAHDDLSIGREDKSPKHVLKRTGRKCSICGECGYRTTHKTHFVEHMRIHTGEKPYKCDHCDYTSARRYSLDSHIRRHTGEKPYKCGQCDYSASHKFKLDRHIEQNHSVDEANTKEQTTDTGSHQDMEDEDKTLCDTNSGQPDKNFSLHQYLQPCSEENEKHVGLYANDPPCSYEDAVSERVDIPQCIEEHTGVEDEIGAHYDFSIGREDNSTKHVLTEPDEKPYMCGKCSYMTANKTHFLDHIRIHTGEKPYKCDHCDYTAARKYSLDSHMRRHTGEKPYKCGQCDYSASNKFKLDRHIEQNHSMDEANTKREQTTDTGSYWDVEIEDKTLCNTNSAQPDKSSSLHLYLQPCSEENEKHVGLYTNDPPSSYEDTASERFEIPQCIEGHTDIQDEVAAHHDFSIGREGNATKHVLKESGEKPYMCVECGYRTASKAHFIEHMRIHTGEKPFKCDQCDFTAARKFTLNVHMRKHTGEKPYKCDQCDYSAAYKRTLARHMLKAKHSTKETNTKVQQTTDTGSYRDMDIEDKTLLDTNSAQPDKSASLPQPGSGHKGRPAGLCADDTWEDTGPKNVEIPQHVVERTGIEGETGDHFVFSIGQEDSSVKHMQKQTGEKPYMCGRCGYRTAHKSHLLEHVRKHTGEKPFKCDQCDYCTSRKSSLTLHMRTHDEEKLYKCDRCDFSAINKALLERHVFKHTGEKPYMCGECGLSVTHRDRLTQHMKIHTGVKPHKCDQCDYSSARKSDVTRHMVTHITDKSFVCDECGFKTATEPYLRHHKRKNHSVSSVDTANHAS